jgi:hypothetical protein
MKTIEKDIDRMLLNNYNYEIAFHDDEKNKRVKRLKNKSKYH